MIERERWRSSFGSQNIHSQEILRRAQEVGLSAEVIEQIFFRNTHDWTPIRHLARWDDVRNYVKRLEAKQRSKSNGFHNGRQPRGNN